MQKTDSNKTAKSAHRHVQSSTTLNRRYVRRPMKNSSMTNPSIKSSNMAISVKKSPKISHFNTPAQPIKKQTAVTSEKDTVKTHPVQEKAHERMRSRQPVSMKEFQSTKMTAKQLKDQAIKKALMSAASMPQQQTQPQGIINTMQAQPKVKTKKVKGMHFGVGRIVLALSCAAAAVFAIVYFVNLNMPDVSLRVAAMQTGINASYPSYVPRDYAVSSITSENGKVVLEFTNSASGESFKLEEETSSWDSQALMTNYVKEAFGDNYSIVKEQGLTIYVNGSNAAWVNGGVVYKLSAKENTLTNKQITSIAVSL